MGSPPGKKEQQGRGDSHDPSDFDALDEFCSGVELNDMEFESWANIHHDLDLRYILRVSPEQAKQGCIEYIVLSRSIKASSDKAVRKRQKSKLKVEIHPGARDGDIIRLKGCGDESPDQVGDLVVTIRFT